MLVRQHESLSQGRKICSPGNCSLENWVEWLFKESTSRIDCNFELPKLPASTSLAIFGNHVITWSIWLILSRCSATDIDTLSDFEGSFPSRYTIHTALERRREAWSSHLAQVPSLSPAFYIEVFRRSSLQDVLFTGSTDTLETQMQLTCHSGPCYFTWLLTSLQMFCAFLLQAVCAPYSCLSHFSTLWLSSIPSLEVTWLQSTKNFHKFPMCRSFGPMQSSRQHCRGVA